MYLFIGILIVIVIIFDCIIRYKAPNKPESEQEQAPPEEENIDYSVYKKKLLLTKREYAFYKSLKPITDKYNLHILAKVRLEDIVSVSNNLPYKEKNAARNRIKPRHIDFVLVDQDFYLKLAIELDDNSHDTAKAQKIDQFKDKLLETTGIPLIRIRDMADLENQICDKLNLIRR